MLPRRWSLAKKYVAAMTHKRVDWARRLKRALVLLAAAGEPDAAVAAKLRVGVDSAECVRRRFVEEGLEAVLYRAFAPAEARRIQRRLALHDTPKHGAWLNRAEVEWSVLGGRRIDDIETRASEVVAWQGRATRPRSRWLGASPPVTRAPSWRGSTPRNPIISGGGQRIVRRMAEAS